jgi:hypothetical protein
MLMRNLQTASMIIIAVAKGYPDLRRLLGAHAWSDFLYNPGEDAGRVSKIYFCKYQTHDGCTKEGERKVRFFRALPNPLITGWKYNDVQSSWFNDWRLENKCVSELLV